MLPDYFLFLKELSSPWEKYKFYSGEKARYRKVIQNENRTLPFLLQEKIVRFLGSLPNSDDPQLQRALIYSAGLDKQLQHQINFANPSAQFFQLLVPILNDYGILEDGGNALEAVLCSVKDRIGQEGREHCEKLIDELHVLSSSEGESSLNGRTSLEDKFIKNAHNQVKLLRNWTTHELLSPNYITEREVAYFFIMY